MIKVLLEHALRVHCPKSAQTPVRTALFEEVRCDGRGFLVLVYSSLIRSVLEYASPVWANLPQYLSLLIDGVQQKALEIIFPGLPYVTFLAPNREGKLMSHFNQALTRFISTTRSQVRGFDSHVT